MSSNPVVLLRRHLGYPAFRPGQEELVRAVIGGGDALGILPTGGGKSVCYQVPALALPGTTLVLTPLVSLMEDQVSRARDAGLKAAHLSASQGSAAKRDVEGRLCSGRLDVLFVAPERLEQPRFRELMSRVDISLMAVDEAHCIAEWGDDFRPSYRRIGEVRGSLACPVLALTATATPPVRDEIQRSLRLESPTIVVKSFDRPNLAWSVVPVQGWHQRIRLLHSTLRSSPGTAIVYAPTRRQVEEARDALAGMGVSVEAYHAGLAGPERTRVQDRFMAGECRVVVATNAFGMGIDKSDVRLVVHLQLPSTLEGYYQEAGRAGRDGEPARCVALHHASDQGLGQAFVDRSHPPVRRLRGVHAVLRKKAGALGIVEFSEDCLVRWLGGNATGEEALGCLEALVRTDSVRRLRPTQQDVEDPRYRGPDPSQNGTAHRPEVSLVQRVGVRARPRLERAARLRRFARIKLAAVSRYARIRSCRRNALLDYFGEERPERCGRCDRCRGL